MNTKDQHYLKVLKLGICPCCKKYMRFTYYAEIIPFCEKDKKTADDFEKKIFDCLSNYEENSKTFNWDILNGEIETIIQLLKRGRLFIHV